MHLEPYLNNCNCPVYAATLGGENLFNLPALPPGVIIIGNESKGISASVLVHATQQIKIPGGGGAESLNAGVSAGIICAFLTGTK
jgi:TrmH family RNA methyltransferase